LLSKPKIILLFNIKGILTKMCSKEEGIGWSRHQKVTKSSVAKMSDKKKLNFAHGYFDS
jgi:hypothetical protein